MSDDGTLKREEFIRAATTLLLVGANLRSMAALQANGLDAARSVYFKEFLSAVERSLSHFYGDRLEMKSGNIVVNGTHKYITGLLMIDVHTGGTSTNFISVKDKDGPMWPQPEIGGKELRIEGNERGLSEADEKALVAYIYDRVSEELGPPTSMPQPRHKAQPRA